MSRPRRSLVRAGPILLAACLLASADARASSADAEACARAAESAQVLRSDGRLLEALDRLRVCVAPVCPAFVRRDCAQWDAEVEASIPTVVVAARSSDGRDLVDVRITVDGQPFADTIDGIEKPLDPGEHRFRFEKQGAPPVEQLVVLREGEKRRPVDVTIAIPQQTAAPSSVPPVVPPPPHSEPPHSQQATIEKPAATRGPWPWIFGGIGVAAAGAGTALALWSLGDYHSLQQGCGANGSCAPSDIDRVRTRMWIGDVAIAFGVVSLGVASWLAIRPLPGGASVQVTEPL